MSNMEQDNSQAAGSKLIQWLDTFLDKLYRNRREEDPPHEIAGQVWGMPSNSLSLPWAADAQTYFLHYFQSQGYGPTTNECVTTSALMAMNMLKDWAALYEGHLFEADRTIAAYTSELDSHGLKSWKYRFPTKSPLPGMMTPWQAILALKDFAKDLRKKYKRAFKVKLSAHHSLHDLVERLRQGNIILIHGAWQMTLDKSNKKAGYNPLLTWLGGMPHTMVLIGYDGDSAQWLLLNPADPLPSEKHLPINPKISRMTSKELMDFWGRKFLFYPPRFAFTTITMEISGEAS